MKFNGTNDRTGKTRSRDQNVANEMNKETNWRRKRKNEKHPGSQRGGGSIDGKQKRKIAMEKWRMESIKPMMPRHE